MKTKIICPVDFSDAANNAIEYAAKLAQVIDAEIMLVNVLQPELVPSEVGLDASIISDIKENQLTVSKKLKDISVEINKTFNIPTEYEVMDITRSLAKTISSLGEKNTMIVMGTNGTDSLSQFFFGTNTYNVIKKAECPVLLIPDSCSFEKYEHILYPVIYEEKGRLALNQFYKFVQKFDAKITFLHMSAEDTEISHEVFMAEKERIEEVFEERPNLIFERAFADDVAKVINDFVRETPTDLLVIAARHRNIIQSIFQKRSVVAELSAAAPCPILVFHS